MDKKIITFLLFSIFIFSFFSGCILEDILFPGASCSFVSLSVNDDEGFPSIDIAFESNGKLIFKTYNYLSEKLDEEYFYGNDNATLKIGSYKQSVISEEITLNVFDRNDNLVKEKTFTFSGPKLEISSYTPTIWKKSDYTSLIGIELDFYNSGDTPVYPVKSTIKYNGGLYDSYILPKSVLPYSEKTTAFFSYIEQIENDDSFELTIKDVDDNILLNQNLSFSNMETLSVAKYDKGLEDTLLLPIVDFLYEYYDNKELYLEDYAAFVFDRCDDQFVSFVKDQIISTMSFSDFFDSLSDSQKINKISSFIQNLKYRKDSELNCEIEDPQYPVDTLFNNDGLGGGDCEDKAILTASLLDELSYDVSLIRIPDHMAVGVSLPENELPDYDYYVDDYYFLDTSPNMELGFVHSDYANPASIDVYTIEPRALVYHHWRNDTSTIYTDQSGQRSLKVVAYIENLGRKKAGDIKIKGIFYTKGGLQVDELIEDLPDINPFMKVKYLLSIDIPKGITCNFDTRLYLDGELVDTETSQGEFYYY